MGRLLATRPYMMAAHGSPPGMAVCAQSQRLHYVVVHHVQAISGDAIASHGKLSDGEQGLGHKSIPAHQEGDLHCGVCRQACGC